MSYLEKIEYEIVPKDSLTLIRNCAGCGKKHILLIQKSFVSMLMEIGWMFG